MVFNPEGLAPGQLAKAVSKLVAAGVAVAAGVVVNEALAKMLVFPFGRNWPLSAVRWRQVF